MSYQKTNNLAKSTISKFDNTSTLKNTISDSVNSYSEKTLSDRGSKTQILKLSIPNPRYEVPRPRGIKENDEYNANRQLLDPIKNPKVLIVEYEGGECICKDTVNPYCQCWATEGYAPSINGKPRQKLKECAGFHCGPSICSFTGLQKDRCFTQGAISYGVWDSNFMCMDLCWMEIEEEKIERERQEKHVLTSLTTIDEDNKFITKVYDDIKLIIDAYKNKFRELEVKRAKIEAHKKKLFDPDTDNTVMSYNSTIEDAKELLEEAYQNSMRRWAVQEEKFLNAIVNGSDYDIDEQHILFLDRDANLTIAKARVEKLEDEKERYINQRIESSDKRGLDKLQKEEISIRDQLITMQNNIPACPAKMTYQKMYNDSNESYDDKNKERVKEKALRKKLEEIAEWEIMIEESLRKGVEFSISKPLYDILTTYEKYKNIVYPTITTFNAKDVTSIKIKESKKTIGRWRGIIMELSEYMPKILHEKVISNVNALKKRQNDAVERAAALLTSRPNKDITSKMTTIIPETLITRRGKIKGEEGIVATSPSKFNDIEGIIIPNVQQIEQPRLIETIQLVEPVKEVEEHKVIYGDFGEFEEYDDFDDEYDTGRRKTNRSTNLLTKDLLADQEDKFLSNVYSRDSGLATTSQGAGGRRAFAKSGINR